MRASGRITRRMVEVKIFFTASGRVMCMRASGRMIR
jgi:hypothetical protein